MIDYYHQHEALLASQCKGGSLGKKPDPHWDNGICPPSAKKSPPGPRLNHRHHHHQLLLCCACDHP